MFLEKEAYGDSVNSNTTVIHLRNIRKLTPIYSNFYIYIWDREQGEASFAEWSSLIFTHGLEIQLWKLFEERMAFV